MKTQVLKTIQKYEMISQGETIVLAVSGGVDSMVLLDIFINLAKEYDLTLIIAHVDHAMRVESKLDAALVCEVAKKFNLKFEQKTLSKSDVKGNFHTYARNCRYDFFEKIAQIYGADKIATAHHLNDHLETVIDRMMKTELPASLIGIRPVSNIFSKPVIRPLIDVTKQQIYEYATYHSIDYREDVSNESDSYLRNRIRRQIVPLLIAERQDILLHARNLSDHLEEDEAYFNKQLDLLMKEIIRHDRGYEFRLSWLQKLPPAIFRRLFQRLVPEISKGALFEVKKFLDSNSASGSCDVGCGRVVKKNYDKVLLVEMEFGKVSSDFCIELALNEVESLPDGRKIVLKQGINEKSKKNEAHGVLLCYNSVRMPLFVRSRQTKDRIKLINQEGHTSIKQLMINAKVPVDERALWPLVVDASSQVLWVPGLKKSPVCLNKPNSCEDLWLEIFE